MYIKALYQEGLVNGIGELGIDIGKGGSVKRQRDIMGNLVTMVQEDTPIVLHVRGREGQDKYSEVAYRHCLEVLKDRVSARQTVQLHCFTGSQRVVQEWGKALPNTYFSFGGACRRFDEEQVQALRSVPPQRLLVETDLPYLPLNPGQINTPQQIGNIIELVARLRQAHPDQVAECTYQNTCYIFKLSQQICDPSSSP